MNLKKTLMMTIAAGMMALTLTAPTAAFAEEAPEAVTEEAAASGAKELTPEEALEVYKNSGYKYTSQRYGFSIVCPAQPQAVIPASMLDEQAVGDVLIFDADTVNFDMKNAWIIERNAFDDNTLPANLAQRSEKDQQAYLDNAMKTMPYEFVRLTDVLGDGNLGLYAVTAKDWEVDENGDGRVDGTLHSDTQTVRTFFRGQYGGHFGIELVDNPDLTAGHVATYRLALQTFQEWPVEDQQPTVSKDKSKDQNNDQKNDKDKKSKDKNKK